MDFRTCMRWVFVLGALIIGFLYLVSSVNVLNSPDLASDSLFKGKSLRELFFVKFVNPTPDRNSKNNNEIQVKLKSASPNRPYYNFIDFDDSLVSLIRFESGVKDEKRGFELKNKGAFTSINRPNAFYHNGKTYIAWITRNGEEVIYQYEHSSGNEEFFVLASGFEADSHNSPAIVRLSDGKIMAVYSEHGGNSFYRISESPDDISSWSVEKRIPVSSGVTYVNLIYLEEEGLVYYMHRGSLWNQEVATYNPVSDTWEPAKVLFATPSRPYGVYWSNGQNEFHVAMTDGNPDQVTNNLYHFYYRDGFFYKSNGDLIGDFSVLPLTPEEVTIVHDSNSTGLSSFVYDIRVVNGVPFIAYTTYVLGSQIYTYARAEWNSVSQSWESSSIFTVDSPRSGLGAIIDYNPDKIYAVNVLENVSEIQEYSFESNGWTKTKDITGNSEFDNVRPVFIEDYAESMKLAWMSGVFSDFFDWETDIVVTEIGKPDSAGYFLDFNSGKYGKAVEVNSEEFVVNLGDIEELLSADEFSLSVWINLNNQGSGPYTVLSNWDNLLSHNGIKFRLFSSPSSDRAELQVKTAGDDFLGTYNLGRNALTGWKNLIFTYDGDGAVRLYLDGEKILQEFSGTGILNSVKSKNNLLLGADSYNGNGVIGDYFYGEMDDVLIFDRKLAETEVKALYDSSRYRYEGIFTNLDVGSHVVKGYAVDSKGSKVETDEREFFVV